jgi:hypothetical protein
VGQVLAFPPASAAPGFERAAAAFVAAHTGGPGAWAAGTARKYRETFGALGAKLPGSAADGLAALETEAGGPNLFGRGAELQVERFRGRQRRRQKAMTVFPSAPGLPFSPGTSSSLIRVIGGAMMRPLTTASASRSSTPLERCTS